MVKRILSFVGREISSLHEAAYLLALSSVASLLFALVRDRLLAHLLGAGPELDVYYAAFRVPDFIFVAVASLVSTSILVPLFTEESKKGGESLRESIESVFLAFMCLILVVSAIAAIFMRPLEAMLFPKLFTSGFGDTLVSTSRILLLSPVFLGLGSFFTSITQIKSRFIVYALGSPLYNIGIIIGILCFLPRFGVSGLGWGVALGAALLLFTQIPFVARDGLLPRLKPAFDWMKIRRIAALSVPRTITLSSQQLTTLGLVSFASFLGAGSISIYNLALNLQGVPLSIIGASYSSAAFPILAKLISEGRKREFLDRMIAAAKHVIFWSFPITALFIVLRAQIVRTVFGSGAFSWSDTRLTAAALALFIVSSVGQSLMLLFVRSFYAEAKTAKPLVINAITAIITIALGALLIKAFHTYPVFAFFIQALMKTSSAKDSAVLMLPLAFSIGALGNLYLHWRSFAKEFPDFNRPVLTSAFHSFGASVIGGYAAFWALRLYDDVFSLSTASGVFFQGFAAGIAGIGAVIIVLYLLKSSELRDIVETIHHKVWKVDRTSLDKLPQ